MSNAPLNPQVVFRAGTHVSAAGKKHTITAADVAASAAAYDAALRPAPLVVGHPQIEDPAYGWVEKAVAKDGLLAIVPERVEAAFASSVNEGRYPNRSACFYPPNAKSNPKPGVWYLKHVGFLGAHPPAVAGLPPIQFAANDEETIAFAFTADEAEAVAFAAGEVDGSRFVRLLRALRDVLIEQFGTEKADRALPSWEIDGAAADVAETATSSAVAPFAAAFPETEKETSMSDKNIEVEALKVKLAEKENQLAAFAAAAAKRRADDDAEFVADLVKVAKVPTALSAGLVAFMATLDASETVAFGQATQTPHDFFKEFIKALPATVSFGEVAGDEPDDGAETAFAAPPGYSVSSDRLALDAKISALLAANPGLDYLEAARRVGA